MVNRYRWSFLVVAAMVAFIALTGSDGIVAHEDGRIAFDLSDLAEGETRTFGEGESRVTATRSGDIVTISLDGKHGASARTVECALAEDDCEVFVSDGSQAIVLSTGDIDWTDAEHGAMSVPHGKMAMFIASDEEGGEVVHQDVRVIKLRGHGEGPGEEFVVSVGANATVDLDAEGNAFAFWTGDHGAMLRCPEGDVTMTLEEGDEDTYLCPKHNVVLEEGKGRAIMKKIHVVTSDDDE